jgi:hypothetical protein
VERTGGDVHRGRFRHPTIPKTKYDENQDYAAQFGLDQEIFAYIGQAGAYKNGNELRT